MTARRAGIVAWSLVAVALVLHGAGVVFVILGRHVTTPADDDISSFGAAGFLLAFIAFPVVGAVIVGRRPSNAVGWLFFFIGLDFAVSDVASRYADYALFGDPGSLPGAVWVGWLAGWLDPVVFASIMLVLLLFPDGYPLTRRWRWVVWLVCGVLVVGVIWNALKPEQIFSDSLPVPNPAGVEWLGDSLGFLDTVVWLGFVAGAVLSVVSVVVRYRRSRGLERDQMKWLALAAMLLLAGFAGAVVFSLAGAAPLGDFVIGVGFAAVPVAVGVGVLRHRLYDIDRAISRTLSFGLVTGVLGLAYVALVLGGQALFSSAAGGGGLVVAASTLVVAALFLPVRARVQAVVDRRFDRHRYDAQRTLDAFGQRLRQQVELDALGDELRAVVGDTMGPDHVHLWLRTP